VALLGTLPWVANAWVPMAPLGLPQTTKKMMMMMTRHTTRTTARNLPSVHSFSSSSSSSQYSTFSTPPSSTRHYMASSEEGDDSNNKSSSALPFWLDIGTKGGAVFWSLVLFVVPILGYNFVTGVLGYDEIEAGKWIGVGFTAFILLGWVSTYLFRVATKDMTYVSTIVSLLLLLFVPYQATKSGAVIDCGWW
jgi:hypothetical protein